MPFVRKKRAYGAGGYSTYFYLVENRRQDGKVRQAVLAYLGPYRTVEEAWWKAQYDLAYESVRLSRAEDELAASDGQGLSKNMDRDRIIRKIAGLRRRIEVYSRYADHPVMSNADRIYQANFARMME